MINLTLYAIQNPIQVSEEEYDQLVQKYMGGVRVKVFRNACEAPLSPVGFWCRQNPRGRFFGS